MENKLCCLIKPFYKHRKTRLCIKHFRSAIKKELLSSIKWGKVPYWIAKSQKEYLSDPGDSDGWEDYFSMEYDVEGMANDAFGKALNQEFYDDDVANEAWIIYDKLLDAAIKRVKIVVE